jgi:hypothetical protein
MKKNLITAIALVNFSANLFGCGPNFWVEHEQPKEIILPQPITNNPAQPVPFASEGSSGRSASRSSQTNVSTSSSISTDEQEEVVEAAIVLSLMKEGLLRSSDAPSNN